MSGYSGVMGQGIGAEANYVMFYASALHGETLIKFMPAHMAVKRIKWIII